MRINRRAAWQGTLDGKSLLVCAGGMGPEKASASTRALIQRGASALLCVGASGALDDGLQVGDLFIAEWVASAGVDHAPIPCDRDWVKKAKELAARTGFKMAAGGLVSVSKPARTPEDKARLRSMTVRSVTGRSGASPLAVDMESAAAAKEASGLPFLAVRVITDDARTGLPDVRRGWRNPARLLAEGGGFLARVGPMRRGLRRMQDFLALLLKESPPGGRPARFSRGRFL